MEWGISRKHLLQFQRAYSVKLSGIPRLGSRCPSAQEERALVVIKTCSKSRAKTRKDALFRWKTLGKEVIRQLRKKKDGAPFELEESLSKGHLLSDINETMLSSTVTQLAWEKDIDLTKGQAFVQDPDNASLLSPSHHSYTFGHKRLSNCLALTENQSQQKPNFYLESEQDNPLTALRKERRSLVYNRVSPLISKTEKEHLLFSETNDDFKYCDNNSVKTNHDVQYQHIAKDEGHVRRRSASLGHQGFLSQGVISPHSSHLTIIPSNVLTNSSMVSEIIQDINRCPSVSKQWMYQAQTSVVDNSKISHIKPEVRSLTSQENCRHSLIDYDAFKVQDVESSIIASEEKSTAICWTEDSSSNTISRKRVKKKVKRKTKYRRRGKGGNEFNESNTSIPTVIESAESSRGSIM